MTEQIKREVPSLASVIRQTVDNRLRDIHTCLPGFIMQMNAVSNTATVRLALKRTYVDRSGEVEKEETRELPILVDVPVYHPQAGGYHVFLPVDAGDECLVLFSERDYSNWYETGITSKVDSNRIFSLSDSVCIPGFFSKANNIASHTSNLQICNSNRNIMIEFAVGGIMNIISPDTVNMRSPVVNVDASDKINLTSSEINMNAEAINMSKSGGGSATMTMTGNINQTGSQTVSGDVTAGGISLNSHVHGGVDPGSGTSGGPQ